MRVMRGFRTRLRSEISSKRLVLSCSEKPEPAAMNDGHRPSCGLHKIRDIFIRSLTKKKSHSFFLQPAWPSHWCFLVFLFCPKLHPQFIIVATPEDEQIQASERRAISMDKHLYALFKTAYKARFGRGHTTVVSQTTFYNVPCLL